MKDVGRATGTTAVSSQSAAAGAQATTTVRQGEQNLSSVAGRLGISTESLRQANPQVKDPNQLKAGQDLFLPGKKSPEKPAAAGSIPAPQTAVADSTARKSDLRLEGQLVKAQLSAKTVSNVRSEPVGERKVPPTESKKGSSGGFQVSASVDLGKMHASAEFGAKDLKNALNSTVDAVEHPSNVLKHAEEEISNAAEVEANQILYGRVPQLPVPPNPVFDAIDAATYNPTLLHASDVIAGGAINGLIDGGFALDAGVKHAEGEIKRGAQHAGKEIGKALGSAADGVKGAIDQASDAVSDAGDAASDSASDAADAASDAADAAGDAVSDLF